MNLYLVVEGQRTERRLYRSWLPLLVPGLREVQRIEDADTNTFFLVAGMGYPSYKDRIRQAVDDCTRSGNRFRLVICVDAEESSASARAAELQAVVENAVREGRRVGPDCTVIVADCCIETWLLGNSKLVKRAPEDPALRAYREHYDVITADPELMPVKAGDRNRVTTHLNYLRAAFRERGMSYSKDHPGDAQEQHYLDSLIDRATRVQPDGTRQLRSFSALLALADGLRSVAATAGGG